MRNWRSCALAVVLVAMFISLALVVFPIPFAASSAHRFPIARCVVVRAPVGESVRARLNCTVETMALHFANVSVATDYAFYVVGQQFHAVAQPLGGCASGFVAGVYYLQAGGTCRVYVDDENPAFAWPASPPAMSAVFSPVDITNVELTSKGEVVLGTRSGAWWMSVALALGLFFGMLCVAMGCCALCLCASLSRQGRLWQGRVFCSCACCYSVSFTSPEPSAAAGEAGASVSPRPPPPRKTPSASVFAGPLAL